MRLDTAPTRSRLKEGGVGLWRETLAGFGPAAPSRVFTLDTDEDFEGLPLSTNSNGPAGGGRFEGPIRFAEALRPMKEEYG